MSSNDAAAYPRIPGFLRRVRPWHVLVVLCIVPVVLIAADSMIRKKPPPQVTMQDVDQARRLWESRGPASYDLSIEFSSGYLGATTFDIAVRGGKVTRVLKDGAVEVRDNPEYWTVANQFDVIAKDIATRDAGEFHVRQNVRVELYADFDPELGYTRRFERIAKRSPQNYKWRVTRFQAVD